MSTLSYAVLDAQNKSLSLRGVLISRSPVLKLVRSRDDNEIDRRIVARFDVTEFAGNFDKRNVECFHLCARVIGHDGAIATAIGLVGILNQLRELARTDPAKVTGALLDYEMNMVVAVTSAKLKETVAVAA